MIKFNLNNYWLNKRKMVSDKLMIFLNAIFKKLIKKLSLIIEYAVNSDNDTLRIELINID